MRRPADMLQDRRGAAAAMMALCMMALMASAAMAVDLGDVFLKTRQLQGVADLAAMAATQSLDPAALSTPQATATTTAGLNPWAGGITAQATTGVYTADPSVAASQRFVANAANPNAVQVSLHASVPLYFAGFILGRSTLDISRTAVAARAQYAAFSIGSGLASLNGGVANAVLSALTGSQVQLSVMNYQALASANVDLLSYLPALQTRAGLQALSFNQVLASSIAPSAALDALADTLTAEGQTAAASAATALATASAGMAPTSFGSLFDLGPYATPGPCGRRWRRQPAGRGLRLGRRPARGGQQLAPARPVAGWRGSGRGQAVPLAGHRPAAEPVPLARRHRRRPGGGAHRPDAAVSPGRPGAGPVLRSHWRRAGDAAHLRRGGLGPGQAAGHRLPGQRRRPGSGPFRVAEPWHPGHRPGRHHKAEHLHHARDVDPRRPC